MGKTCLNCKYEPDWSEWESKTYGDKLPVTLRSCVGNCKSIIPALPRVVKFWIDPIRRYDDGAGIHDNCKVWKAKK